MKGLYLHAGLKEKNKKDIKYQHKGMKERLG